MLVKNCYFDMIVSFSLEKDGKQYSETAFSKAISTFLNEWKKCYMKCGVWNQMKIWSSHLLDNLSNCLVNLKNSGDSTGFEPMTSAMPVQCSNQLSYEVTQLRAGQFVGLMFSRERNVVWKKCYVKCGVWNTKTTKFQGMSYERSVMWSAVFETQKQQNFKHRTSYNTSFIRHSFHGKTWAQQIDLLSTVWLHSSVG